MLTCDLLLEVRATRAVTDEQVRRLERLVFGNGKPTHDHLDLIFLIDTYLERRDPSWADLFARAALIALAPGSDPLLPIAAGDGRTAAPGAMRA
jgi:hypothetical protein